MIRELIILEKKEALKKLPSIINNDDICYLLSKDYFLYIQLNKALPSGCRALNLSGRFNKEINSSRLPYLELFSSLNKNLNSLEWWGMHIASRNSASIPLQLNICYLLCAKRIIEEVICKKKSQRLIFIVESFALSESIRIIGEEQKLNVLQNKLVFFKVRYFIRLFFLYIKRILFYIFEIYKNRNLASSIPKLELSVKNAKRNTVLVRSWITKGTLKKDGLFIDRNFGELPGWLKSKGYRVIVCPMFFNLDISSKEVHSLIKKQNIHFLIQNHYLKLVDYFKVIFQAWKGINISLDKVVIKNLDLSLLFREVQLEQGFATLQPNLIYPLLKRLEQSGCKIDKFYYPFENNLPEKPFILGCKNYFPNSKVTAFQHTAWYGNQLGMFLGDNESDYHPIADEIICSGPIYINVLKNAGFPANRLVAGPSLRYNSINKDNSSYNKLIRRPNILLPLTFDNNLAYDLIDKVKIVLEEIPELFVYIRRHPLLDYQKLENFLNQINFTNFEYADQGSMHDWFPNTDIILSTGGSIVIVETVAKGVPLIRIEPDNNFFLDPLAWSDYPIKPVNNANEIIDNIRLLLGIEKEYQNKFKRIGKDVLFNYFTQINQNNMKVFN